MASTLIGSFGVSNEKVFQISVVVGSKDVRVWDIGLEAYQNGWRGQPSVGRMKSNMGKLKF